MPDSLLAKENRPAGVQLDRHCRKSHQGQRDDEAAKGEDDISGARKACPQRVPSTGSQVVAGPERIRSTRPAAMDAVTET